MNQLYISRTSISLIGDSLGNNEIEELKSLLGDKLTNITLCQEPRTCIMAKGLLSQDDISTVWRFYENEGYLLRRIGDVKI
jgi:hypothetical protein